MSTPKERLFNRTTRSLDDCLKAIRASLENSEEEAVAANDLLRAAKELVHELADDEEVEAEEVDFCKECDGEFEPPEICGDCEKCEDCCACDEDGAS